MMTMTMKMTMSRPSTQHDGDDDGGVLIAEPPAAPALSQQVHDRRLSDRRIRRRISINLPRLPGRLPPVRRHPFADRIVRLVHAIVRAAVDRDCSFALRRFRRVYLAGSFKSARHLHTEVAQYRRARLCRMVVEKNIVAVSP